MALFVRVTASDGILFYFCNRKTRSHGNEVGIINRKLVLITKALAI